MFATRFSAQPSLASTAHIAMSYCCGYDNERTITTVLLLLQLLLLLLLLLLVLVLVLVL